jgi:hypothetical protein
MESKLYFYKNGDIKFKDLFINGKPHKHYFYSQTPSYHLYLSVHYDKHENITRYIKHKYPTGYYEYLIMMPNGLLKDKMYKSSPYCKYIEKIVGDDVYLTVHRYDMTDSKCLVKRSSEYLKNGLILRETFYENGKLISDKTYKKGKPIRLYKSKADQPSIKNRP